MGGKERLFLEIWKEFKGGGFRRFCFKNLSFSETISHLPVEHLKRRAEDMWLNFRLGAQHLQAASCKLFGLGRNSFQMSQLLRNQQPGPTLHRETNLVKQKQWQRKVRCFLRSFFEELYILYLAIESMKWPTMGILMPGAPNTLSEGYLDPKHLPKYPKIHSQSRVLEH